MSTALQFTSVFDPANPPQKLFNGGMKESLPVATSKALEAQGVKTEAIKDLETPPPVSVAEGPKDLFEKLNIPRPVGPKGRYDDSFLDLFYNDFFKLPSIDPGMLLKDKFIKMPILPDGVNRNNDLQMILRAQNDGGGIMATPMKEETGLAALAKMTYGDTGKIAV